MAEIFIDLSRTPTAKEKQALHRRRKRLEVAGLAKHLDDIEESLLTFKRPWSTLEAGGLRVRSTFSWLRTPIPGDASDRKAPPRELRPSATRIGSSTGSALRLELIAMAVAQLRRKAGAAAHLAELSIPIAGSPDTIGWADLVAVQPTDSNSGGVFHRARDKRARTVRTALDTLEAAGLVDIAGDPGARNRYENFVLLNESGLASVGERQEYTTPKTSEFMFTMPPGFVLNNWMHVLEDSEISVLLMAACGAGAWADEGLWAFPGYVRLRHYGIHRDPFAQARKTLEWLGLLQVHEVGRHEDGRAEDDAQRVHRIGLDRTAFEKPALPTMRTMIQRQLER